MLLLLPALLVPGWSSTAWDGVPFDGEAAVLPYNLSEAFYDAAMRRSGVSLFFSWHAAARSEVEITARRAFDVWAHNSRVAFSQSDADARIELRARELDALAQLSNASDEVAVLGLAARRSSEPLGTARIWIDRDRCWYADRGFCLLVRDHLALLYAVGGGICCLGLAVVLVRVRTPATSALDTLTRSAAWSVGLGVPLSGVATYPCFACYDLETVLVHEIGHALGILHADESTLCGCGEAVAACDVSRGSAESVMHSAYAHRASACLEQDDVDAVRTIWGGDCAERIRCYEAVSTAGLVRVAVGLFYAFVASCAFVALRNTLLLRISAGEGHGGGRGGEGGAREEDGSAAAAPALDGYGLALPSSSGPRRAPLRPSKQGAVRPLSAI